MSIHSILLQYEPKRENVLRAIKDINRQWGSFGLEETAAVADYFEMAPAAVYSAASFYDEIHKEPLPRIVIQICDGTNCRLKQAESVIESVERQLNVRSGDQQHPRARVERISCVGRCLDGPIVIINGTVYERVTASGIVDILRGYMG